MSVINKNIAAAFGYAVFGRAVFGVDFSSQYIPSELYDGAEDLGLISRPEGFLSKRAPFKIDQPGTLTQKEVWDIFLAGTKCFAKQPETGGVGPPAIGPRSREWWYNKYPDLPPIYYNYFMKETLLLLHQGVTPDWCKIPIYDDTYVEYVQPNNNYGGAVILVVQVGNALPLGHTINRSWLKLSGTGIKKVHLYIFSKAISITPLRSINVHQQDPASFDEGTITWNNQPALGPLLTTIDPPFPAAGEWFVFDVEAEAICIKIADESIPVLGEYELFILGAHERVDWQEHPYWT